MAGIIQDYWVEVWGLPSRFIPTEGGTLDFAGVDRMTYASLPTDGASALYRDGSAREATVPANGRCYRSCEPRYKVDERIYAFAIEFHHAALDHYFISASAADIEALDGGRFNGWKRTGQGSPSAPERSRSLTGPCCRFYIPLDQGNSHFYSASTEECAVVRARFPNFILESLAAFYVEVPDPVTGSCPPDEGSGVYAVPVYRLWNQRSDSNHRYTSSASIRDEMLRRGYVSEGVFMCFWTSVWDY